MNSDFSAVIIFIIYLQGGPKVNLSTKKLNSSVTARIKEAAFFTNNKEMFTVHTYNDKVRQNFVKYHYWLQQKNFTFSYRKKITYDKQKAFYEDEI